MAVHSAGLLLWRRVPDRVQPGPDGVEVLIVHPGGPYWANKQDGAWTIPKGEFDPSDEAALDAAEREFAEELGTKPPAGARLELGETKLKSGKRITAWAIEGDLDPTMIVSNTFEIEWPPRSGSRASFPEVDEARWVDRETAATLLNPAQVVFVERLLAHLT